MKTLTKAQIKMLINQAKGYAFAYDCTKQDCYGILRDRLIFRIQNEIRKYKKHESEVTQIIAA